jgi:hypothetical protein
MVMTTEGSVPTPDHDAARAPGGKGRPKRIAKVAGSLPGNPPRAGQGGVRTGWRGGKGQGGSLPGNPRRS